MPQGVNASKYGAFGEKIKINAYKSKSLMNYQGIVDHLREAVASLSAVYVFGSQVTGHATAESDLDVALLTDDDLSAEELWDLSSSLANLVKCDVDLLDLRGASTVMQYRIITTGKCVWAKDSQAALYESFILSQKTALDEARAGLLQDIQTTGTVYGR
ncbi:MULTISPECIES: type VII toxin-antitoxin system MntA family adenylyltransferase antitoxin [Comamonas]|uniref:type VII toxin-antitoxin system MntA family adenylyltransferase antitoxin n=1 Tax=Comamonas TaxID=283 RepID=UPI0029551366|nr:nucleotidyltransferase domain-containing protein [Comamonas thiooxydans]